MQGRQREIKAPQGSPNSQQEDQFFMTGGIRKRKIFLNVEYTRQEKKWVKMVREELKKQNLFEVSDDSTLLKFYYSSNFNMDKCIQKLKLHHYWFSNPQIQCMTEESKSILRDGFIYSYSKTKNGRPFIIMNLSLLDIDRYQFNSYYQAINHIINRVIKQQYVPGKIEFHYFIIDLNEQLLSLPLTSLSKIIGEITEAYNSCLEKMMIVNCTTLSKWIYNRVTSFVSEQTTNKVKLYTKQDLTDGQLTQYIDRNILEKKYGGAKANIDHSKAFRNQQISDDISESTQYFSIQQNQPFEHLKEASCCGNYDQCSIY